MTFLTNIVQKNMAIVARSQKRDASRLAWHRRTLRRRVVTLAALGAFCAASILVLRDAKFARRGASPSVQRVRLTRVPCGGSAVRPVSQVAARYVLSDGGKCATAQSADAGACVEEPATSAFRGGGRGQSASKRVQRSVTMRCLPSFIIVGAQKAATGSLSDWLSRHPHLRRGAGPRDHVREVHYFDALRYNSSAAGAGASALESSWRTYLQSFPRLTRDEAAAGVATFEKSPSYVRFKDALALARALLPSVHLVVVLRDPVMRAYSAWGHHAARGRFATVVKRDGLPLAPEGSVRSFSAVAASDRRRSRKNCEVEVYSLAQRGSSQLRAPATCARAADVRPVRCAPCFADDFDAYVRDATVLARPLLARSASAASSEAGGPRGWAKTPTVIDVVADGDYAAQLEELYALFPARQVHVLLFDDVTTDPLGALDELQSRLGLPYHDFEPQLRKRKGRMDVHPQRSSSFFWRLSADAIGRLLHRGAERRSAQLEPMLSSTRALLSDFYAEPLDRLWALLKTHGEVLVPPPSWPSQRRMRAAAAAHAAKADDVAEASKPSARADDDDASAFPSSASSRSSGSGGAGSGSSSEQAAQPSSSAERRRRHTHDEVDDLVTAAALPSAAKRRWRHRD